MRSRAPLRRGLPGFLALGVVAMAVPIHRSVHAAPPVVTLSPTAVKIKVAQASLGEAIDALSRAAGFKVTYEGGRPGAMIYNAEIDTPTVAQTLFRLIDGQNLNYAVMFDRTGKKVTTLMVLGVQPKTGAPPPGAPSGAARPQPFTPPRGTRNDNPVVEDDPTPEPEPTPQPTPAPSPQIPPRGGPGGQGAPFPPSPFAPRSPFGSPFGPRPSPSPSP